MPQTYDAIIVGSGATGGWAAMELTRAAMKVLMIEAGSHIDQAKNFHHTFLYQIDYRGQGKPGTMRRYSGTERTYRIMLDNEENPYTTTPDTVYRWGRSRCLGGRTHGTLVARHRPHGRLQIQSRVTRRVRHRVADLLRRHQALLRSRRELHARGLPAVPRWPFPARHAAQLRGGHPHRGGQESRMAYDPPPPGATDSRS
jgi:choline dehydrogenase-like flavoprotein